MTRHAEVYSADDPLRSLVANRLGWVDVAGKMADRIQEIETFGQRALVDGLIKSF